MDSFLQCWPPQVPRLLVCIFQVSSALPSFRWYALSRWYGLQQQHLSPYSLAVAGVRLLRVSGLSGHAGASCLGMTNSSHERWS